MLYLFLLVIFVFASAFVLTGMARRYAITNNIVDTPNSRSSHVGTVPRGGGIGILVSFLIGMALLWMTNILGTEIYLAVSLSSLLVAGIGFWDDHGHISAKWRLLIHIIAASIGLFYLIQQRPGWIDLIRFDYSLLAYVTVVFLLVWLINLFNFMDGIDGIAGSEAVFIALSGALLAWQSGSHSIALQLLILGIATTGFLFWNWPPAKIFLGDVGSGFLGLILGMLAIANILEGGPVWSWIILFGVFFVDATVTLIRRIINREKWYEAHRSHAYQWSARLWGHQKVTVSVIIINTLWLFPWACYSFIYPQWGHYALLAAFLPLILIAHKLKAGRREVAR